MSDQSGPPFGDTAQGWENWIWINQIIFGPTRGAILLAYGLQPAAGDLSLSVWGALRGVMEGFLADREADEHKTNALKTTERVLVCFGPQFLKLLHTEYAQSLTDGGSLAACEWGTAFIEAAIVVLHATRT